MKAKRYGYHILPGATVPVVAATGLRPMPNRLHPEWPPVVFFGPDPCAVWMYFADREDAELVRFPWPKGARCPEDARECVVEAAIPVEEIEIYEGHDADAAREAYWETNPEKRYSGRRYGRCDRVARSRLWRPIRMGRR